MSCNYIEEREEFYALTSMMFMAQPTLTSASALYKILNNEYFPLAESAEDIRSVHDGLREQLKLIDEAEFFERLDAEYYHLFFDPRVLVASPWQSSYTNADGLLFQETDYESKKYYAKWGFKVAHDNFPRDHIAIELDFMKLLSQKFTDGETSALKDSMSFLDSHILAWIDEFISALEKGGSVYYLNFAKIVKAGGEFDRKALSEFERE